MTTFYTHTYVDTDLTATAHDSTSLLFKDAYGSTVCHIAGLPAGVARATADAFNAAMRPEAEPDPLDAETVAARQSAYERDLIDAGRGHLIGGAA